MTPFIIITGSFRKENKNKNNKNKMGGFSSVDDGGGGMRMP